MAVERWVELVMRVAGKYSEEDKSEAEEPVSQSEGDSKKEKHAQKSVERVSVIRGYGRVCLSGSPTKK